MFDHISLTPQFSTLWMYPTPSPVPTAPTAPTASEPDIGLSLLLFFARILERILRRDPWKRWSTGRYRLGW